MDEQADPFATSVDEIIALFEGRGFELVSQEKLPDSISPRRGAEALLVFRKAEGKNPGQSR
jgi:hypothetical protein